MKHLLKLLDLSKEEITELLDLADRLKAETKAGVEHHILKGKTLGMIFEKSSTRTRVSFETGMYQLGGHALFLSSRDLQIGRGEPVEDTARVLSRYLDGIMIRTFAQEEVETLARVGSIPIINGLTDFCHPCQVLADLQTVREYKGRIEGLNMCYIGDGNNMANSLIVGFLKMGAHVSIACPKAYQPDAQVLSFTEQYPGKFFMTESPEEAAKDADVISLTCGLRWGRRKKRRCARRRSAAIRLTRSCWRRRIWAAWCSTACPRIAARKSRRMCLNPTPTRFSMRRRTDCTHRRQSWLLLWRTRKTGKQHAVFAPIEKWRKRA